MSLFKHLAAHQGHGLLYAWNVRKYAAAGIGKTGAVIVLWNKAKTGDTADEDATLYCETCDTELADFEGAIR